jgi:hypothetical protein
MKVAWATETKTEVMTTPVPETKQTKADVTVGVWGLNLYLKLSQQAAKFYLLMDLEIDGLDGGRFQKLLDSLLPQFVAYTDMAVGGELRHSNAKKQIVNGAPLPLRRALSDGTLPSHRHEAWRGWYRFRRHYGTLALQWAQDTFHLFTGGGFGGPKWANIAHILHLYETEEITPLTFVDTCWGLQHNGGTYFNKAWGIGGLQDVLDSKQASDIPSLLYHATPGVREFYNKKRNGGGVDI